MFKPRKRLLISVPIMLLVVMIFAACRSNPVTVEPSATATTSTSETSVETTATPLPPLSEAGTGSQPLIEGEADDESVAIEETAGTPDSGTAAGEEQVELVEEPIELVICMSEEPDTLYPLSRAKPSMATTHVLQGIYENMFTTLGYDYQARGIVKMPSLADGDAEIKSVQVDDGDTVLDVNEDVVTLREGVTVLTVDGEEVTFEDTPLRMPQMVVQFSLQPLTWSDGTPVTADDSVYSFELASDPETPFPKTLIERTASYKATGDLTLEWTAVPGYLDPTYFTNIWTPYPRHEWGEYSSEELLEAEASTRLPLSHGPYIVSEWVEGDHLTLVRNDNYYLAGEGLPKVDVVIYRFVPNSSELVAQLITGACTIGTHDGVGMAEAGALLGAEQGGTLIPYFQSSTVFEHVDFGINPVDAYAAERVDWFEDVRVRQALVMCTDRQSMVDEILFGRSQVMHSYVPETHPLYPDDMQEWPYDVTEANRLLDSAGYLDDDGDGYREDSQTATRFEVSLIGALGNHVGEQVANMVKQNLADCGVDMMVELIDSDLYFADGPEGPLFGRQFDLASFPWLISIEPNCSLYLSSQIPGPENGWNSSFNNETGYTSEEFDDACMAAISTMPGEAGYEENHKDALRIWSQEAPIIPLFARLKVAAARQGVLNFVLDPTQESELWNLYEIEVGS